eukprot:gene27136-biopygen17687
MSQAAFRFELDYAPRDISSSETGHCFRGMD